MVDNKGNMWHQAIEKFWNLSLDHRLSHVLAVLRQCDVTGPLLFCLEDHVLYSSSSHISSIRPIHPFH
jgi:hypothetical protein